MKLLLILLVSGIFSNSHDITTLPDWGPYSKTYNGISHVGDLDSGLRVDFFLCSGQYRRSRIVVPNALCESDCYPWEVSTDLRHISYRQEIEWKDKVYVDVTYHVLDSKTVLTEMHCVNNSDKSQYLNLRSVASLSYDDSRPVVRATGAKSIHRALDYTDYEPSVRRHNYNLVYNGLARGEVRDPNSLTGSVIQFTGKAGDSLRLPLRSSADGLYMRYKAAEGSVIRLSASGTPFEVSGTGEYTLVKLPPFEGELCLCSLSGGAVSIDSFLCGEDIRIEPSPRRHSPKLTSGEGNVLIKWTDVPDWYAIAWNYPLSDVVRYDGSALDLVIRNRWMKPYTGNSSDGVFVSAEQRPLMMKARSDTTLWNLICRGSKEEVAKAAAAFRKDEASFTSRAGSFHRADPRLLENAEPYLLGEKLIEATVLTDIVYPIYTQKQYIRHFTPGKNWNSLYTWDSGMIDFALNELDPDLAFENIRAYTTEVGCQSAFIHHGTPLPIQFFAYADMCSKTCDEARMEFLYPRLKQFYDYMTGHSGSSTTRLPSNLLRTWDYFYNSGGWDDYPPQWYMKSHPELYPYIAPMISTSCYIRAAKILRMVASRMSLIDDVKAYDKDIREMSNAILDNAWDPETGYFSYVTHDASGKPEGIFRAADGSNFNMGLDGVSPLLAGIGSPEQKESMVSKIFSKEHMWTPYGISTVDRSASYYRVDGYWNGCIWMPHQFLQWKAMLDLGLPEKAHLIAFTALDTWKEETSESYQCYEHFFVDSGRGAGWHNFSGLSAPMVCWFNACFRKGTISTGFDAMINSQEWASDWSSLRATLSFDKDAAGRTAVVAVCMAPAKSYKASVDGKSARTFSPYEGLVYVFVPQGRRNAELKLSAGL